MHEVMLQIHISLHQAEFHLHKQSKSLVCNNYESKEFHRVVRGYNSGNALLCCHGVEIMLLCIPEHFFSFSNALHICVQLLHRQFL